MLVRPKTSEFPLISLFRFVEPLLGLIHPPVGMNVFVIKSVVKDVSFTTIF